MSVESVMFHLEPNGRSVTRPQHQIRDTNSSLGNCPCLTSRKCLAEEIRKDVLVTGTYEVNLQPQQTV